MGGGAAENRGRGRSRGRRGGGRNRRGGGHNDRGDGRPGCLCGRSRAILGRRNVADVFLHHFLGRELVLDLTRGGIAEFQDSDTGQKVPMFTPS